MARNFNGHKKERLFIDDNEADADQEDKENIRPNIIVREIQTVTPKFK